MPIQSNKTTKRSSAFRQKPASTGRVNAPFSSNVEAVEKPQWYKNIHDFRDTKTIALY